MNFPGPVKVFGKMRYRFVAEAIRHLNRIYRFTGSPEFRPRVTKAAEKAIAISISPHPDDDVLAVGGAIAGHIVAGGEVHSVVMTDGVCGTSDAATEDGLVAVRRLEAEKAAGVLKVTSIEFWDEPDGKLEASEKNIERLQKRIREIRPDYIYTPFPIDYHFDHLAATAIVIEALSRTSEPVLIRGYESIIPLIPNYIVDITDFIDLKRRAVACFESQNAVSDYQRTIVEGLNRHRSYGAMAGKGYGEALFESEWKMFEEIFHIVHGKWTK